MHRYTDEQKKFIEENVKGITSLELTKIFNENFGLNLKHTQIRSYTHSHGLKNGMNMRFKKGQIPVNKGKKQSEYMSQEAITKTTKTRFRKGNTPANRRPIGSERVDVDGYTYVKIKDGHKNRNWELKHVLLWEQHNGPIPKGYKVIFANRDRSDIRIENLILVSDAELLDMNQKGLIFEDPELTKTGANLAKLNRAISDKNVKKC